MAHVLLISDKPEYRDTCGAALRRAGLKVLIRDNMIDGIRELNWYDPQLLLCDVQARSVVGTSVPILLRDRYRRIPILLINSEADPNHPLAGMAAAKIGKSESFAALLDKVQELLALGQPKRGVAGQLC